MKKLTLTSALLVSLFLTTIANAADYIVDYSGAHASVNFKIQHLGYSWLTGRFDKFEGKFSYDENNIAGSTIEFIVDTASISSNHAERDKHLRSGDFLDVSKFSSAKFTSTKVEDKGDRKLTITGDLSLHGVVKSIVIEAEKIGEGNDPWGGYRIGFSGTTSLGLKDFGINTNLGPASTHVELSLHIEGIRQ